MRVNFYRKEKKLKSKNVKIDIFHIGTTNNSAATVVNSVNSANPKSLSNDDDEIVSFDAGSDFNLNFFETRDQVHTVKSAETSEGSSGSAVSIKTGTYTPHIFQSSSSPIIRHKIISQS